MAVVKVKFQKHQVVSKGECDLFGVDTLLFSSLRAGVLGGDMCASTVVDVSEFIH